MSARLGASDTSVGRGLLVSVALAARGAHADLDAHGLASAIARRSRT